MKSMKTGTKMTSRNGENNLLCLACGFMCKTKTQLHDHLHEHKLGAKNQTYPCRRCSFVFDTHYKLEVHVNAKHRCNFCRFETGNEVNLRNHVLQHVPRPKLQQGTGFKNSFSHFPFKEIKAFKGYLKTYRHRKRRCQKRIRSVEDYFRLYKSVIKNVILDSLANYKSIKVQFTVLVEFIRNSDITNSNSVDDKCLQYINANMKVFLNEFYFEETYSAIISQIQYITDLFEKNGSGWTVNLVKGCDIRIAQMELFKGGCFMPVPQNFLNKRAVISPDNPGRDCFDYAFLIVMHYGDVNGSHRERYKQYHKFRENYNFDDLNYPTTLLNIKKFEKTNESKAFSLNIFGVDSQKQLYLKYQSQFSQQTTRKNVDLLFVQDSVEDIGHFMAITNVNRLLGSSPGGHRKHLCYNCMQVFSSDERLAHHHELCFKFCKQKTQMPSANNNYNPDYIKFNKFAYKLKSNYVIYADLEALPVKIDCQSSDNVHDFQKHIPSGYCFTVIDWNQNLVSKHSYRGKDCIEKMFEELETVCAGLQEANKRNEAMSFTEADQCHFDTATECHICEKPFSFDDERVKDHDWNTGKIRGAAHRQCNANYTQRDETPIFLHNFRNYDSHLLLGGVKRFKETLKVIPNNSEKFLSIKSSKYIFLDSMMFLSTSLNELVSNLREGTDDDDELFQEKFKILVDEFGLTKAKLLARKGLYPYQYMSKWSRFSETSFPLRKHFYNSLTETHVSRKEYEFGKKIFSAYCKNMGDYHDLYLLCDTLLLACVFENFRKIALRNYKLDPVYYYSLAGYAWDSALYATRQCLELITCINMYIMMELGLRGGVSMISCRYKSASNKHIDPKHKGDSNYLFYCDKTNLYGEGMLQYLATGGFAWESETFCESLTEEEIQKWEDEAPVGRVLMVDLDYPEHLHNDEAHNEYPLAPEKIPIPSTMLSPYQKGLIKNLGIHYSETQAKLVPHLGNRKRYVLHYRNLKYYLSKGLVLKKVHSVIRFNQSPWLRDYVLFNANLRKQATNKFEKDLYKFFVNSIFGKSMQQVRNHEDAYIVSDLQKIKSFSNHANFRRFQILGKSLAIVFMAKATVKLNKPIYIALSILDLSKLFMFQWHYDKIKKWYRGKSEFFLTDTDSLAYSIKTDDLFKDLEEHKDDFDFSDYPKEHFLHSNDNKKVIGKMKDESNSKVLASWVGLAPKLYSMVGHEIVKKAAKGVKRSVLRRYISHRTFMKALFKETKFMGTMNLIRSKKHVVTTSNVTKVALHCFDSKRFIMPDGIHSLAHNHYLIKPIKRLWK